MAFLNLTQEGFRKSYGMRKQKGYIGGHAIMKETKINPKILYMATVEEKSGTNKKTLSTIHTYFWKNSSN